MVKEKCQVQDKFTYVENYFKNRNIIKKKNLKAIVTAGPTREYLDPVRYISNGLAANKDMK